MSDFHWVYEAGPQAVILMDSHGKRYGLVGKTKEGGWYWQGFREKPYSHPLAAAQDLVIDLEIGEPSGWKDACWAAGWYPLEAASKGTVIPPSTPKAVTPEQVVNALRKYPDLLWGVAEYLRNQVKVAGPWVSWDTNTFVRCGPNKRPVVRVYPSDRVVQTFRVEVHGMITAPFYKTLDEAEVAADAALIADGWILAGGTP
jgi:hypothetical protein